MTATVASSPVLNDTQFCDNNGNPLNGGYIYSWRSGGFTVPLETYADSSGTTLNSNPIQLDSAGRVQTALWLIEGEQYNFTVTDSSNVVLASYQNIYASLPAPIGGGIGTVIWNQAGSVPTSVSSTVFNLDGLVVDQFTVGGRVRYQFTDQSYGYGTITDTTYFDPYTQITFVPDSVGFSTDVTNVAWSAAVAPNYIIDSGAICWTQSLASSYPANTVGGEIVDTILRISSQAKVYPTSFDGSSYTITTEYPITVNGDATYNVQFESTSSSGVPMLNVNNIGAQNLVQFGAGGIKIPAELAIGFVSNVVFDGTDFIIMNPLPAVATGSIIWYPATSAPSGYLVCDGSTVDYSLYPRLGDLLGSTFGGTYQLPDLRGQFIRGWDDGADIDSGRTFGSTQGSQMESHNHSMYWTYYDGGGGRGLVDPVNPSNITAPDTPISGQTGWGLSFAGTGTENRPTNVALLPCIKT